MDCLGIGLIPEWFSIVWVVSEANNVQNLLQKSFTRRLTSAVYSAECLVLVPMLMTRPSALFVVLQIRLRTITPWSYVDMAKLDKSLARQFRRSIPFSLDKASTLLAY
jgi:hypothetical protein